MVDPVSSIEIIYGTITFWLPYVLQTSTITFTFERSHTESESDGIILFEFLIMKEVATLLLTPLSTT